MKSLSQLAALGTFALSFGPVVVASRITYAQSTSTVTTVSHTFTYTPEANADVRSVSVAGAFNGWDKNALLMAKGADGTWRATASLPYGKTQYKIVVNGEKWQTDPKASKNEDDGNGNVNSVLLVLPSDYVMPAKPDDGIIARSALLHEQKAPYLNYDRGKLTLSLRVRPNDVQSVAVEVNGKRYPMARQSEDELYARYNVAVPWNRKSDLQYRFALDNGKRTQFYGAMNSVDYPVEFTLKAADFKPFVVPSWVEQTVFYQIFPDRFENGDKTNDPKDVVSWDAKPQWFNRFGGDAKGVEQHIGYLAGLGVGTVYFNPVFASPSNHRYDATDYKQIASDFGTNADFIRLTKGLQSRGIRTVMDFVFNHTATNFFAFQDVRDKGETSPYKNWYFINSFPVTVGDKPNYQAWYGFSSMPKLNVMNAPTHEYLLGLVNYWKERVPLSGMRLDVANEVDMRFWRDLRVRGKGIDPNLWIVGEVWGDGSPWLGGDQWDSVMNYQFRDACVHFFAEGKTTPTQFMSRLTALDQSYAPQVSRNMMNLLSSHDTPRFLTLCGGNADLHRLAALLQFTWVGAPSIYYGEEIGMEGGGDPDNRRPMSWDKATNDNAMLAYYKKLVSLRNTHRVLQSGDAHLLATNDQDNTLAFVRVLDGDIALVALNRSREPRTVILPAAKVGAGKAFTEAFTGKPISVGSDGSLTVTLAPLSGAVLLPRK